ncbi:hypothetical protein HJG60_010335 [Phyllostomus discolor]|uniref:Uncharacterized protein n=1 Tax=Phyllostomus discolor TaxID=89673 RepID=A0A834AWN4_9CHIR|nr:hypothetical protein HJG60_010335 [Phyllostomus discolor]
MCPDWESHWRPFGSLAGTQSTESHQPGQDYSYVFIWPSCTYHINQEPIIWTGHSAFLSIQNKPFSNSLFLFYLLIDFRERGQQRGRGGEKRERNIDLLHLFIHLVCALTSCMCAVLNPQPWHIGTLSN